MVLIGTPEIPMRGRDDWAASAPAKQAAERLGTGADFRARVRSIIASYVRGEAIVGRVLRAQLADA